MKKTLFILIGILFLAVAARAEVIHLKTGKKVEGKILTQEDGEVVVEFQGVNVTYYVEDIDYIRVDDPVIEESSTEETVPVPEQAPTPVTNLPASLRVPAEMSLDDTVDFYYQKAKDILDNNPGRTDLFLDQVVPYGEEMILLAPENPYGYYILSRARRYLGYMKGTQYDKDDARAFALPLAEKAIALAPDNSLMHMNLAMCYYNMSEYVTALGHIDEAVRLSENEKVKAHNVVHKGIILKAKGDLQKARGIFEKAEKMPMEDMTKEYFYDHYGSLFSKFKQYNRALVYKKKHVEIDPEDPWALHNLGSTYRRAKKFDEAIHYELKALEIMNFGVARAGLSNAYRRKAKEMIKEGRNLGEAEGLLFKALEYDAYNEKAYEWLGRYYEKTGDQANMRKYVDETLMYDPGNKWALKRK